EQRPFLELELAALLVEDAEAGDVGRLQVGGALDARRLRFPDAARDRAREHGLSGSGNVLEEDMAAADQRGEDEADLFALAENDRLDVLEQALDDVGASVP